MIIAGLGDDEVSGGSGRDLIVGDRGQVSWDSGRVVRIESLEPGLGGNDTIDGGRRR